MTDISSLVTEPVIIGFNIGLRIGFTFFFICWIPGTIYKLISRTV